MDVMPTLLELVGGSTTRPPDGLSLVPLMLDPDAPWRDEQFLWNSAEKYRAIRDDCAVRNPCYWYAEYEDGQHELYELNSDPYQLMQLLPNAVTGYEGQPGWTDPQNPVLVALKARLAAAYAEGGGVNWPPCKVTSKKCTPTSDPD
jgi:arylsulfatase A-like enzyme